MKLLNIICLVVLIGLFSCKEEKKSLEQLWKNYIETSSNRDWNKSIESLNEFIELDPNHAQAYYARAMAISNLGRNENLHLMLSDLNKSIELDSSALEVIYLRFQTNFALSNLDNAMSDIQKIIDINGEAPLLLSWKGNCAFASKKFKVAELSYEKRLKIPGPKEDMTNNYNYWVLSKYFGGNKDGALWDVAFMPDRGFEENTEFLKAISNDKLEWASFINFKFPPSTVEEFYFAIDSNNFN